MEKQKEGSGREKGPFAMVAEYKLYGTAISYDSIYFSHLKKKGGGGGFVSSGGHSDQPIRSPVVETFWFP